MSETQNFPIVIFFSVRNNEILAANYNETHSHLLIYDHVTSRLSSFTITYHVMDAIWTPKGNILYILALYGNKNHLLESISETGQLIKRTEMKNPRSITISSDDVIYLASHDSVYRSANEGVSWSLTFKIFPEWRHCLMVVKVTFNRSNDYLVLQSKGDNDRSLGMYSINEQLSEQNVTLKSIEMSFSGDDLGILEGKNILAYDGGINFFLNDWKNGAVYAFSFIDPYVCQLRPSNNISDTPQRLAFGSQQLYVGQINGIVTVYKLAYENHACE